MVRCSANDSLKAVIRAAVLPSIRRCGGGYGVPHLGPDGGPGWSSAGPSPEGPGAGTARTSHAPRGRSGIGRAAYRRTLGRAPAGDSWHGGPRTRLAIASGTRAPPAHG